MDRKRKRHSGIEDWTAARCQRLLRPIASRILPLRRLSYITGSQKASESNESSGLSGEGTKNGGNIFSADHSLDPAWFPGEERRPNLKKYSSRNPQKTGESTSKKSTQQENDSLIVLPTPFKARALRRGTPIKQHHGSHVLGSPSVGGERQSPKPKRAKKDPFARAPLAKQSAELQNRQNYERIFELHQGVSDGFSLLLQRTAITDQGIPEHKGAPSLLKMCLRNIPSYIQAEEDWRKSIDEDDETDVAAEVYEELEDLGVSAGHGWPGLRDVVLAHGIKLVREIIRDKLVSMNTRAELANMPLRHGLTMEAEGLVHTYAHSLPIKRPSKAQESPLFDGCLMGLREIGFRGTESAKDSLHVRLLGDLFHSGQLCLSWLASRDMIKFSREMIRSLASKSRKNIGIVNFMHERISQVCRVELEGTSFQVSQTRPNDRVDPIEKFVHDTTINTITVLTAIVLIERKVGDPQQNEDSSSMIESSLNSIAIDILRKLHEHKTQERRLAPLNGVCFAILTSVLILQIDSVKVDTDQVCLSVREILQGLNDIHGVGSSFGNVSTTMIERAALYTCNLARCCGQSANSTGLDYLQDLVQCIMKQSEDGSVLEITLLRQLALESSLCFSKVSATQKSRVFMENIESAMLRHEPLQIESPGIAEDLESSTKKRKGLRWEEGLCEWIAATPLVTTNMRSRLSTVREVSIEESDINDSGYLSALQETPAPRKKSRRISDLVTSPDVLGMTPGLLTQAAPGLGDYSFASGSPKAKSTTPFEKRITFNPTSRAPRASLEATTGQGPPPRFDITKEKSKRTKATRVTRASDIGLNDLQNSTDKPNSKPEESSSAPISDPRQMSTTQAQTSTQNFEKSVIVQTADDDEDELALSCKKPRQARPPSRPVKVQKARTIGKKRPVRLDESEDELG